MTRPNARQIRPTVDFDSPDSLAIDARDQWVASAGVRSNVATIAVQAAEAVVQKRLDAVAQRQIVDDYLNRVGSQN